jgi:hypothetical protein
MTDLKYQLEAYMSETSVPVDVDAMVADRERGVGSHVTSPNPGRRRRLAVAVVSAILVIVAIGVPLLIFDVFSPRQVVGDPTTTTTEPITTTTAPATTTVAPIPPEAAAYPITAAMDDVAEFHDLWNSGDIAAFTGAFSDPEHFSYDRLAIAMQVVGAQLETECGPGAHTDSGSVDVTCAVTLADDRFYAPAGIQWTREVTYTVDDTGVDAHMGFLWGQGPSGEALEYLRDFDDWLFERHQAGQTLPGWIWVDPDNGLLPNWLDGRPCCLYSVETRSAAAAMVALVDEFLAIPDDRWPMVPPPLVIETTGSAAEGSRGDEVLFALTHDPDVFADVEMVREPNGVLASYRPGWHSYVWHVFEFVPGNENSPGDYLQVEIHRLWSADEPTDVLWLTDYSGASRDTLTGYPIPGTPPLGPTFVLLDALVLEGRLDLFGLHNDCQIVDDDIGAALLSFEGDEPVVLIGWTSMPRRELSLR